MKKTEISLINLSITACLILIAFVIFSKDEPKVNKQYISIPQPVRHLGFDVSQYVFEPHALKRNQNLGDVLVGEGVSWDSIIKLDNISTELFSIRKFRAKKPFTLVRKDTCAAPHCIVYEPNKFTYIKYYIGDKVDIKRVDRQYDTCVEVANGEITSSLWMAMKDAGLDNSIIDKMEDAMASSVDFYHTQKGDKFKLVYEKIYIDGKPVSNGEILSAAYNNNYGEHFAVLYENENYSGFYDLEGRPTKSSFLRAPLRYSRISSRFNRRRFHPIKKRTIPHLGTDYAAPTGTPIFSVADGTILAAGYSKNNGKYVKIRHDDVYTTQYLHMNGYAKGIKRGARVKQGETIGYVGQTGLATGPHVCFRFWKRGRQINHMRENFAPKDPLPPSELDKFYATRDSLMDLLNTIDYPVTKELIADNQI